MNIKESLIKVLFKDDAGKDHGVEICDLIDSGTPTDEESGDDMEFVACYSSKLASVREQIQEDIRCLMGDGDHEWQDLTDKLCQAVVDGFAETKV